MTIGSLANINYEARKIVGPIPLYRDLKEAQDELSLPLRIAAVLQESLISYNPSFSTILQSFS